MWWKQKWNKTKTKTTIFIEAINPIQIYFMKATNCLARKEKKDEWTAAINWEEDKKKKEIQRTKTI